MKRYLVTYRKTSNFQSIYSWSKKKKEREKEYDREKIFHEKHSLKGPYFL